MNPKREAFVREYLVDNNAKEAAIRAGYSAKTAKAIGCSLLKQPEVRKAVNAAMAEQSKAVGLNAQYVLDGLMKLAEECMTDERWNPAGAAKAYELLGKNLALFTDKTESRLAGADGGPVKIQEEVRVTFVRPHD